MWGWEHINLTGDYVWRKNRRARRAGADRYERLPSLSVLFIPFREVALINSPGFDDLTRFGQVDGVDVPAA